MDTRSQVRRENQETSWRAKSNKYLGFAVTSALLVGRAIASGTEGLSMPGPAGSVLDLGGSNNLTDHRNAPPIDRKYIQKLEQEFENPPFFFKGPKDVQRTSGGETSQSVTEKPARLQSQDFRLKKKVTLAKLSKAQSSVRLGERIPSGKTPRSAIETSSRQLERSKGKRRESLEAGKKVLALKENEVAHKGSQDVSNEEIMEGICNLLNNEKFGKVILSLRSNKEFLKDLPSFQDQRFVEHVNKLIQKPEFVQCVNDLRQKPEFVEHVNKLIQKPEFVKSIRPLLDEKALIQEHSEKPRTHGRRILWNNRNDYRYKNDYGYKNDYRYRRRRHIFGVTETIHDLADFAVSTALTAGEILFVAEAVYTAYYCYKRYCLGNNSGRRPYPMRLIDRWAGGNAGRNRQRMRDEYGGFLQLGSAE